MPDTNNTGPDASGDFLLATSRKLLGLGPDDAGPAEAQALRWAKRLDRGVAFVVIDTALLSGTVLLPGQQPARPQLTVAWRHGAAAPCGVHLGLAAPDGDALRACATDEAGVARRAMELDRYAVDALLLSGEEVMFILDRSRESRAMVAWANAHGHCVLFDERPERVQNAPERPSVVMGHALAWLASSPAFGLGGPTLDDLRELLAQVLAARPQAGRQA